MGSSKQQQSGRTFNKIITMLYFIFFVLILVITLLLIKTKAMEQPKTIDIGMYFMNLYTDTRKRRDIPYHSELMTYYWILGLASQGRTSEIESIYNEDIESLNEKFVNFLHEIKPRISKMNKIAEKVDNMRIENMKDGESIGEWQNRKVKKYKTFMDEFEYFKAYDIELFLKNIS